MKRKIHHSTWKINSIKKPKNSWNWIRIKQFLQLTLTRYFGLSGIKINKTAEDKAGKENNATKTRHALISKLLNVIISCGMINHAPPAAIMLPNNKKLASVSIIGPRLSLDKNSAKYENKTGRAAPTLKIDKINYNDIFKYIKFLPTKLS